MQLKLNNEQFQYINDNVALFDFNSFCGVNIQKITIIWLVCVAGMYDIC